MGKPRTPSVRNVFASLPPPSPDEAFEALAKGSGTLVERIVSHGQTTPEGTWLRSDRDEWVVLIRGSAALLFRESKDDPSGNDPEVFLKPGDSVTIPAGLEHRVTRTDAQQPTVWLAVHFEPRAVEASPD